MKENMRKLRKKGKENLKKIKAVGKEEIKKIKEEVKQVKENIVNVPNAITLLRILATPLLVYVLWYDFSKWFQVSVFIIFALSDALDGFIARNFNQKTNFGAKFDMIADRIFFSTVAIIIAVKLFMLPQTILPSPYLFFLLLTREIITLPIAIYMFFNRSAFVPVKITGKITTLMQGVTLAAFLIALPYTIILIILTGISGIWAGLTYWKDSIGFLKGKNNKN